MSGCLSNLLDFILFWSGLRKESLSVNASHVLFGAEMASFTPCPSDTATGPVGAFFGSGQSHVHRAPWQSSCLDLAIFQKSPDSPQQEIVFREHNPSSRVLAALGCPCFWVFLLGNTINYSFKEKKKLLVYTISNLGLRLLGLLQLLLSSASSCFLSQQRGPWRHHCSHYSFLAHKVHTR